MVCREQLVGGAQSFGMETVRAFGSAYWFGPQTGLEGPWVAPLFTAGNLFYLAILTHLNGKKAPGKPSLLRALVTTYIAFTGVVELTRFVWDVSRFALVWAALHNLAEWGVIGFTVFKAWILLVSQWILFAPTLTDGGLGEQLVGLLCDWLLVFVWVRLYRLSDARKRKYILFGLLGALGHMAEILPLVSLLIGVVKVPSVPGCLLISFSTPITFWCYHKLVDGWDASGDDDLVSSKSKGENGKTQDLSMPIKKFSLWVIIAFVCSCATIIGPAEIIPICPTIDMKVSPGEVLPADATATLPGSAALTGTHAGVPINGQVPAAPFTTVTTAAAASHGLLNAAASNESLCASNVKLTGTTTVIAKPGKGEALRDMIATMPGPIRQEDGALYYEEAYGGPDGLTVKFFESWSSIRSLYKHIYTSPTVRRVFFSEAFRNLVASQVLEGPFQAMVPCSEAEKEAQPVTIPFSTIIDAPVDCLWAKIDNWSGDYSWVQHAQGITPVTPTLRILHFKTTDVPVIRQTAPLAAPEQPANGHRLIYYMLGGGFLDTIGEVYRGDLTIVPSAGDPSKTLLTYSATIVAKDPSLTSAYYNTVFNDFTQNRVPFLQAWGRDVGSSAACKAGPTPAPAPQPAPSPPPASAVSEYFYVFALPAGRPATPDTTSLLAYLLSKTEPSSGTPPEVLYAANVGKRNFPAAHVPGPDMKKAWDVTLVVRFPVGSTVRPADIGAGVATDSYRVEVRSKPLPTPTQAAACPDSPELTEAMGEVKAEAEAMFQNFYKWKKLMDDDPTNPNLPVKPDAPMSGINLLRYRDGPLGEACYQRYLLAAYNLIHHFGGGLYYFAEVVQDSSQSSDQQWSEVVIPLYNTGHAFFNVVFDPSYFGLLQLRDATLRGGDQANIDVSALPGTSIAIP